MSNDWDGQGPMPPWARSAPRERTIKPRVRLRPLPRAVRGTACGVHGCGKWKRCPCGYCDADCTERCQDPHARCRSRCLICAWCLACGRRFHFDDLEVQGVDLCLPCRSAP
jgi:hypothetical protein